MAHKYRIDTVTRTYPAFGASYDRGSERRGYYYARSIGEIIGGFERRGNYKRHARNVFTEYRGTHNVTHFITRIY